MKYLIVFFILVFGSLIYLLITEKEYPTSLPENSFLKDEFVSIENNKFKLNGKKFFPLVLNYIVTLQTDGENIWPRPSFSYYDELSPQGLSRDSAIYDLRADLHLIKEMGFNTVRIVSIGEIKFNDSLKYSPVAAVLEKTPHEYEYLLIARDESFLKYFSALEELFKIVNEVGLKIIFLVRDRPDVNSSEYFIQRLVHHFKNDATILAYDLFNEPLYFDKPERSKREVFKISKKRYRNYKKKAPNHLFTIGLVGIREVFEWDPNLLTADFLSFHPYEYEPEQVRNEIYWYGKYVKKPWIIGETAIPAENDSIPYEDQKTFARNTIIQSVNCGAAGYSWWQYKDVNWNIFHQNYMGVISRDGIATTKDSNYVVKGTVKPVADEFKNFNLLVPEDSCRIYGDYYNYSTASGFRLTGSLFDKSTNKPIEGGVIIAWNEWWGSSYHTVTKADGKFELLSSFPLYHWMASATEYSMVRDDISPDTSRYIQGIPTIDIGNLKIKRLNF